ncbi:MAG: oligosaccharide flippase family protein [Anaerotignum sp.]
MKSLFSEGTYGTQTTAGRNSHTCRRYSTKCMGFFYRIFMSNYIGAEGMGLYQLILPLYTLAWSITAGGFTITVSRLTAR